MKKSSLLSTLGIIYFMVGVVFTIAFAIYYRWPGLAFLSPGFFSVVFTWPYQAIGFARDLMQFGLAGKPI